MIYSKMVRKLYRMGQNSQKNNLRKQKKGVEKEKVLWKEENGKAAFADF